MSLAKFHLSCATNLHMCDSISYYRVQFDCKEEVQIS